MDSSAQAHMISMQASEAAQGGRTAYVCAVQDLVEVVIGADLVIWNDVDLSTGQVAIDGRNRTEWEWLLPNLAATAPANPMVHAFLSTRVRRPHRMSDLVTAAELRRSRLYVDLFKPMGARFQVGIPTRFGRHASIRGWALNRQHADFDTDEMDLLGRVQTSLNLLEDLLFDLEGPLRPEGDPPELELLTTRERQVLDLLADGWTAAHIARYLRISPATVRKHLEHIYDKVGVRDRLLVAQRFGRRERQPPGTSR